MALPRRRQGQHGTAGCREQGTKARSGLPRTLLLPLLSVPCAHPYTLLGPEGNRFLLTHFSGRKLGLLSMLVPGSGTKAWPTSPSQAFSALPGNPARQGRAEARE